RSPPGCPRRPRPTTAPGSPRSSSPSSRRTASATSRAIPAPPSTPCSSKLAFQPQDPDFEARVRATFARQLYMTTIGAELVRVAPGEIDIALPFRADLTQQHGYLHAGVVTAIVDTACG